MEWSDVREAAADIGWFAYLGTTDGSGLPHVAVVAPGLATEGVAWFATRASSKKCRNLMENPAVAFHWPVGGTGPGELIARGTATIHGTQEDRHRLWEAGVVDYDLAGFFGSVDNADLVFVEVALDRVRLLGPDAVARVWRPD